MLKPGDRTSQLGFVDVGRVAGLTTPAAEFTVPTPSGDHRSAARR